MRPLVAILAALVCAEASAIGFPMPGPGYAHYGQALCSSLPAIAATPVSATTSDNLATKLGDACTAGAGILELAAGTYSDVNLQIGAGGVAIGGECEIRAANPASKPILRAGIDVNRAVIQVRNVPHRIRFTNLACDGRRSSQTASGMTSICADTAENGGLGNGICDDGTQSLTNRGCIDSRVTSGGPNSTCVLGFEASETVWDAIFLRNQTNSVVEASTVDGTGCDTTTCPALSVPADNSLNSILLVGRGINLVDSAYVSAFGNTVTDVTKQGLQCYGSTNCITAENDVTAWGISGITMLGSSGVVLNNNIDGAIQPWAQNSTTTNNGQGILVTDGGLGLDFRVAIRGNLVENTWGNGIASELQAGTPPEPVVIVEGNTINGPCNGTTHEFAAGLFLGDTVDDHEAVRSVGNTVTASECSTAVRVRNVLDYYGRSTTVSGTVSGGGVNYTSVAMDEDGITTDEEITIDAASSGAMSNCTLNGVAVVNDSSGGAVTRTNCGAP